MACLADPSIFDCIHLAPRFVSLRPEKAPPSSSRLLALRTLDGVYTGEIIGEVFTQLPLCRVFLYSHLLSSLAKFEGSGCVIKLHMAYLGDTTPDAGFFICVRCEFREVYRWALAGCHVKSRPFR